MRLIDADYAIEQLKKANEEDGGCCTTSLDRIMDFLGALPTLSAVPVAHGRWELERAGKHKQIEYYSCSICGFGLPYNPEYLPEYCEHCGAKMDGGDGHVPEPPEVEQK